MGWSFKRRIKLGPVNVNLSRSGVGVSAGAGPFRAGLDAKGRRYTTVRGPFGIYNRQYYDSVDCSSVSRKYAQNPNTEALQNTCIVLVFSVAALAISYNSRTEGQTWFLVSAALTGIPAVLGLFGCFAKKDASTGWFRVIALILKVEKWLVLGFLLVFLIAAAGSGRKRRR
ncbi:MAG TPA: DUF4236 domain-containing protein [Candidatus Angelobacter sp.]|nr:DUF4236 domain-containing protein [Candidatus Angelobacter sp.]